MSPEAIDQSRDDLETVAALRDRFIHEVGEATRRALGESPVADDVAALATLVGDYSDAEIDSWHRHPSSPKGRACRAGCWSCCHVPIAATVPEVVLIGLALRDERDAEQMGRLRELVERNHRARSGLVGRERKQLQIVCPLLEGGRCSIYEIRPITCRGWSSLDVARCESFHAYPAAGVEIPIDGIQYTIAQGIGLGVQRGLKASGLGHRLVDLVEALRIILADPGAIDRWLDGEPAFADAELAPVDPDVYQIEATVLV